MAKRDARQLGKRHYFFLNPYQDAAFTKCPKCGGQTKVRKFPLVLHIEPHQLFLLNKSCRYCTACDLIIARKSELEPLMATGLEQINPQVMGNQYVTIGVLDRKDWREGKQGHLSESQTMERAHVFKDVLNFEPAYPTWGPDPKKPPSTHRQE